MKTVSQILFALTMTWGEEKSGYDCAKFVVKYCQEHNLDTPSYDIQSSNIVGKDNIRSLMNNWHRVFKETET